MDNSGMSTYVIPVGIIIILILIIWTLLANVFKQKRKKNVKMDQASLLADANKRLASNPKDWGALKIIADVHYNMDNYEKAMKTYQLLLNSAILDSSINDFEINLNYGLSCMKCKAHKEAYQALAFAREKDPNRGEINSALGKLEYMRKNHEKAVLYLKRAIAVQPDNEESLKYYGLALFKLKRYRDASLYLKQTITSHPEDKEAVFSLACCYYENHQHELALKFFTHLRADPLMGPNAALYSGTIYQKKHNHEKACTDFSLGLRHQNIPPKVKQELLYRLANSYNQMGELKQALEALNNLSLISPNYKDVKAQLSKCRELNKNNKLRLYLRASTTDFGSLCRQIAEIIIVDAKVKVSSVTVEKDQYIDLLTEVKARKWEDTILFRFSRSEGLIGELMVRELYARMKEVHAGRGFFLSPGSFSRESDNFVEARLIDLINKDQLLKLLNKL